MSSVHYKLVMCQCTLGTQLTARHGCIHVPHMTASHVFGGFVMVCNHDHYYWLGPTGNVHVTAHTTLKHCYVRQCSQHIAGCQTTPPVQSTRHSDKQGALTAGNAQIRLTNTNSPLTPPIKYSHHTVLLCFPQALTAVTVGLHTLCRERMSAACWGCWGCWKLACQGF